MAQRERHRLGRRRAAALGAVGRVVVVVVVVVLVHAEEAVHRPAHDHAARIRAEFLEDLAKRVVRRRAAAAAAAAACVGALALADDGAGGPRRRARARGRPTVRNSLRCARAREPDRRSGSWTWRPSTTRAESKVIVFASACELAPPHTISGLTAPYDFIPRPSSTDDGAAAATSRAGSTRTRRAGWQTRSPRRGCTARSSGASRRRAASRARADRLLRRRVGGRDEEAEAGAAELLLELDARAALRAQPVVEDLGLDEADGGGAEERAHPDERLALEALDVELEQADRRRRPRALGPEHRVERAHDDRLGQLPSLVRVLRRALAEDRVAALPTAAWSCSVSFALPAASGYSASRLLGGRRSASSDERRYHRLAAPGSKATTFAPVAASMCSVHAPRLAPTSTKSPPPPRSDGRSAHSNQWPSFRIAADKRSSSGRRQMLVLLTKRAHLQPAARPAGGCQSHTDHAPASAVTICWPKSGSTESDDDESVGQPEKLELPIEEMLSMVVVARSERSTPTPRRMSESGRATHSSQLWNSGLAFHSCKIFSSSWRGDARERHRARLAVAADAPRAPRRALPGQTRRANVVSRAARAGAVAPALPLSPPATTVPAVAAAGSPHRHEAAALCRLVSHRARHIQQREPICAALAHAAAGERRTDPADGRKPPRARCSCDRRNATRCVPTRPTSPSPGAAAARSAPCCR